MSRQKRRQYRRTSLVTQRKSSAPIKLQPGHQLVPKFKISASITCLNSKLVPQLVFELVPQLVPEFKSGASISVPIAPPISGPIQN